MVSESKQPNRKLGNHGRSEKIHGTADDRFSI